MQSLIEHTTEAVDIAHAYMSFYGVAVEGMTGIKVRRFLQEICWIPGGRYLEIGVWKGGTFLSAVADSPLAHATAIDNWATFGGPREEFLANLKAYQDRLPHYEVIDQDCWTVPPGAIRGPIDVYFYDGSHTEECQTRAITHFWPALNRQAVIVVDDWDDPNYDVAGATREGLRQVGCTPAAEWEFHDTRAADGWWNGLYIAVVEGPGQ